MTIITNPAFSLCCFNRKQLKEMILSANKFCVLATWRFNNNCLMRSQNLIRFSNDVITPISIVCDTDPINMEKMPKFIEYNKERRGIQVSSGLRLLWQQSPSTIFNASNCSSYLEVSKDIIIQNWPLIYEDSLKWFRQGHYVQVREELCK